MKNKFLFTIAFLCCVIKLTAQNNRPNILFFLVDDLGWQDTSVPFANDVTANNKKFFTPSIDRLSQQGMKFTNAYSNSVCTPSRVSFLTGMNAAHHRVTNWTKNKDENTDAKDGVIVKAPMWNVNGISPVINNPRSIYATTLPQLLKEEGYYTVMCGKAHFGAENTIAANPLQLGFMKNIAGSAAGNPLSYLSEENYGNKINSSDIDAIKGLEKYWDSDVFLTQALTTEAKRAIDTSIIKNQPFFLYMAHYAVHLPYDPDKRFMDKYRKLPPKEAAYASLIEGMDKSLGDLMKYLEEKKLSDNTIIIFYSDNGGYTRSPRMGKFDTQNSPLRGGKGSLFEGGIRVPAIIKWNGVVKPNTTNNQYFSIQDLFPTILQMAKISYYKTVQKVDGESIVPFLENANVSDTNKILFWHFPNKWTVNKPNEPSEYVCYSSALRKGDWKIIYYYEKEKGVLYNLKNDLGERFDLSIKFPVKKKEMLRLLTDELKRNQAQLPEDLKTNKVVAYPH